MKWTPWIKFTGSTRPEGLDDSRRMQAAYISSDGNLNYDGAPGNLPERSVRSHFWDADTLAYRLKIVQQTYTLYGGVDGRRFDANRYDSDTHKITCTVEDGEVISCVMERLYTDAQR